MNSNPMSCRIMARELKPLLGVICLPGYEIRNCSATGRGAAQALALGVARLLT